MCVYLITFINIPFWLSNIFNFLNTYICFASEMVASYSGASWYSTLIVYLLSPSTLHKVVFVEGKPDKFRHWLDLLFSGTGFRQIFLGWEVILFRHWLSYSRPVKRTGEKTKYAINCVLMSSHVHGHAVRILQAIGAKMQPAWVCIDKFPTTVDTEVKHT